MKPVVRCIMFVVCFFLFFLVSDIEVCWRITPFFFYNTKNPDVSNKHRVVNVLQYKQTEINRESHNLPIVQPRGHGKGSHKKRNRMLEPNRKGTLVNID